MAKNKGGRPKKYGPETKAEVCRLLSEGVSLAQICARDDMPDFSTIWKWEREDDQFSKDSARAMEYGTHAMAHEAVRIADDATNDWMSDQEDGGGTAYKLNGEHIQRSRLRIDTRLRLIGKWNRKIYGDKVNVENTTKLEETSTDDLIAELKSQLEGSDLDLKELLK